MSRIEMMLSDNGEERVMNKKAVTQSKASSSKANLCQEMYVGTLYTAINHNTVHVKGRTHRLFLH